MGASPKRRGWLAAAICAAWLLVPSLALADKVELETGEVFVGKIIRNSKYEVSIQLKAGGVLSFKWTTVRKATKGIETLLPPAEDSNSRGKEPRPKFPPPVDKTVKTVPRLPVPQTAAGPQPQPGPRPKPVEEVVKPPEPPPVSVQVESLDDPAQNLVTDDARGFAVAPPESFVPWVEAQCETLPHAFVEPFTRTNFTVAAYRSPDSILQVKKNALKSYTEQFKVFNVVRDDKLVPKDKSTPDVWLVEIDSRLGSISVRQIQLFTRSSEHVVILTYSAMGENYAKYLPSFVKSMESFRFLEASAKAPAEDRP